MFCVYLKVCKHRRNFFVSKMTSKLNPPFSLKCQLFKFKINVVVVKFKKILII